MNRTLADRGTLTPVAALASALAMLVALTGPGLLPASADQFTPLEDPPSILVQADNILVGNPRPDGTDVTDEATGAMIAAVTGDPETPYSAFSAFQPASTRSTEIYNVFATITTNGQLKNVTEVRFCLYDSNDARYSTDANIDVDCGIPADLASSEELPEAPTTTAPERLLVIRWIAGETPTVTVVGTNNYADAGTFFDLEETTEDGTTRSAKIRFSFQVSNAMQVSDGWKIRVAAESQASIAEAAQAKQTSVDDASDVDLTVNYFAEMTTGRADSTTINYGIVTPGVTVLKTNVTDGDDSSISTGSYTANDASVLTINGTDFITNGEPTNAIPLATNGDIFADNTDRTDADSEEARSVAITNVPSGTVSLDCAFVETVSLSDDAELQQFVQVRNAARVFALDISKTGESPTGLGRHSCMVNYPGGGPVANVVYSNTVTVAPIQTSGTPALGDGGGS